MEKSWGEKHRPVVQDSLTVLNNRGASASANSCGDICLTMLLVCDVDVSSSYQLRDRL